jgi:hypothetical protein
MGSLVAMGSVRAEQWSSSPPVTTGVRPQRRSRPYVNPGQPVLAGSVASASWLTLASRWRFPFLEDFRKSPNARVLSPPRTPKTVPARHLEDRTAGFLHGVRPAREGCGKIQRATLLEDGRSTTSTGRRDETPSAPPTPSPSSSPPPQFQPSPTVRPNAARNQSYMREYAMLLQPSTTVRPNAVPGTVAVVSLASVVGLCRPDITARPLYPRVCTLAE